MGPVAERPGASSPPGRPGRFWLFWDGG